MTKKLEATKIKLYECIDKGDVHPKVIRRLANKMWNIEHRNELDDSMWSFLQSKTEHVRSITKDALAYHHLMGTLNKKVDNIFKEVDGNDQVTIEHLINEICRWCVKILQYNRTMHQNKYAVACIKELSKYKETASLYELMYCKELEDVK